MLDISQIPSSITAHAPGYIDRENEIIFGLQTEAPFKRAIMPNGGFRMVLNALKTHGYEPDPRVVETFTKYRKTHNDAVFDAYTADIIRDREGLSEHVRTLKELQKMAASYGVDISVPSRSAREAVQWLYLAYPAAVKEQNGAAMSLGRTSTFLDIYFERDLASGSLTEEQAQEIVDDFTIKLRIVRFLRTPEYD